MKRFASLLPLLLALFAAAGCITDPVTGRTVVGAPISEAEERQMGLQYRPLITHEYSGPYPDAELQQHLGGIVMGMAARSVRPDLPWTFTVLNTSVPNAFAVPGGQVFVTRGLLVRMEDEAEFAVVMGHELGHVEHRHSVQAMGRDMLIQGGAAAIGAGIGDGYDELLGLGAALVSTKYSRDQERESDIRGVKQSYAAGYDPREGADVFREFMKMKQESGGGGGPDWLSSHPADEERIQNVLAMSAELDPRLRGHQPVAGLAVTTSRWPQLIARLRQEQKTYDVYDAAIKRIAQGKGSPQSVQQALPQLEQAARALPNHALLSSTVGKALLVLDRDAEAAPWLQRASQMNQGLADPEWMLGMLALDGQRWNDAVAYADRALTILPGDYRALWVRGEGHWGAGRRQQAQQDFQQVMQTAPKQSEQYKGASARIGGGPAQQGAPAPKPKRKPRQR
ncbi:MAG: Beta-barrel assembly-enhancing protease [Planctomycetes bacterium]|nr:Beta-barrel assembly-enhancing protease [Planctomycetota bacterium]